MSAQEELLAALKALVKHNLETKQMATAMSKTGRNSGNSATLQFEDVIVLQKGTEIILPEGMAYAEAVTWIERFAAEQDKKVAIHAQIPCFPLDGAIALVRALKEIHGFVSMERTPGFFGSTPPVMVSVPSGINEVMQVPWGRMALPGITGFIDTHASSEEPTFIIGGEVARKDEPKIHRIIARTKELIRTESIYKGKAVRLNLGYMREEEADFDIMKDAPTFIDLAGVRADELILPRDCERLLDVALFTPIQYSQRCRDKKVPLKRGVLLSGNYGVGKTLTAYVTALKAVMNGWTMLYLKDVQDLAPAIELARLYAPAVVFAEDVDRVVGSDRTNEVDEILNTIDGLDSKDSEVIVVLTTNHLDDINAALLRPGRLDAVVPIPEPDTDAAMRLVRLYGRGGIADDADLSEVGRCLAGKIPAVIREVVERSKMYAIADPNSDGKINPHDLVIAAKAMDRQIELISKKSKDRKFEVLDHLADRIVRSLSSTLDRTADEMGSIANERLAPVNGG